eukprot:TRINITY_DN6106_c0_g2_i1.p1 TRINITY_DN6106_c0_g2~~TRINITY_DN6106_c0_g2_i1.p1  ORF type:complete len:106 (-),score=23.38 TRINITY_DN6106_c0_g2_i1:84-401(-)
MDQMRNVEVYIGRRRGRLAQIFKKYDYEYTTRSDFDQWLLSVVRVDIGMIAHTHRSYVLFYDQVHDFEVGQTCNMSGPIMENIADEDVVKYKILVLFHDSTKGRD